jgi:hypothetical protein
MDPKYAPPNPKPLITCLFLLSYDWQQPRPWPNTTLPASAGFQALPCQGPLTPLFPPPRMPSYLLLYHCSHLVHTIKPKGSPTVDCEPTEGKICGTSTCFASSLGLAFSNS